jgi:hypothetical protein
VSVTDPEDILRALAGEAPDAGDTFAYGDERDPIHVRHYRVTGWLRRRPAPPPPANEQARLTRQILDELRAAGKIEPPRGAGPDNVPLMFCRREEAEYVCGAGVAGVIVRVSDVVVDGHVDFPGKSREEARRDAEWLAGEPLV